MEDDLGIYEIPAYAKASTFAPASADKSAGRWGLRYGK